MSADFDAADFDAAGFDAAGFDPEDLDPPDFDPADFFVEAAAPVLEDELFVVDPVPFEPVDLEAVDFEAVDLEAEDFEAVDLEAEDFVPVARDPPDFEAVNFEPAPLFRRAVPVLPAGWPVSSGLCCSVLDVDVVGDTVTFRRRRTRGGCRLMVNTPMTLSRPHLCSARPRTRGAGPRRRG